MSSFCRINTDTWDSPVTWPLGQLSDGCGISALEGRDVEGKMVGEF